MINLIVLMKIDVDKWEPDKVYTVTLICYTLQHEIMLTNLRYRIFGDREYHGDFLGY